MKSIHVSISVEIGVNQPYWGKVKSSLSADAIQALEREQEQARISLTEMNHLIPVETVKNCLHQSSPGRDQGMTCNEEANHRLQITIQAALEACRTMRIPFQSVVEGKLPPDPILAAADEEVDEFRSMDMGLDKVEAAKDVVDHFKGIAADRGADPCGAQVVVTRGVLNTSDMAREILLRGARVELRGTYGNRVATLKAFSPPQKKKRYKCKQPAGVRDTTKWRNFIDAEIEINQPYWNHHRKKLPPPEDAGLTESLKVAEQELIKALHENGGILSAKQVVDYEAGQMVSRKAVGRVLTACETLRIPLQCVVAGEIPRSVGCSPTVETFRKMDLGLKKFARFSEMKKYFDEENAEYAVLTGGPQLLVVARNRANNNKMVVQISGAYGNRLVHFVREDDFAIAAAKERRRSKKDEVPNGEEFSFSNRKHLLNTEKSVVLVGNEQTLRRDIKKNFPDQKVTARQR